MRRSNTLIRHQYTRNSIKVSRVRSKINGRGNNNKCLCSLTTRLLSPSSNSLHSSVANQPKAASSAINHSSSLRQAPVVVASSVTLARRQAKVQARERRATKVSLDLVRKEQPHNQTRAQASLVSSHLLKVASSAASLNNSKHRARACSVASQLVRLRVYSVERRQRLQVIVFLVSSQTCPLRPRAATALACSRSSRISKHRDFNSEDSSRVS